MKTVRQTLLAVYDRLRACYGPQHWWPAGTPFEVIVGAILTQSVAWANVEKSIASLREADLLSPRALREVPPDELAKLIKPCGYYNVKARKLQAFAIWLGEHFDDSLDRLFAQDVAELRRQLLAVYGIGEETADSIILYAGGKPVFVIDAYTRRILTRLGLEPHSESYAGYQALFTENLPQDAVLFNEYHALLVALGKDACRRQPRCGRCCLREICANGLEQDS